MFSSLDRMIEEREGMIIRNAIDLINIPSVSSNLEANRACLDYLAGLAEKENLDYSFSKKKDCLVVDLGKGEETIGILVHVDVVDVGDRRKWRTPPFAGQTDSTYLIGRGAVDNKGPAAVAFNLLCILRELDLKWRRRVRLIVGTREEANWTDMESYKNEFSIPDFSFSPDGAFPIHNMEKGYADVVISIPMSRKFRGGEIIALESGDSANTIPSSGRLVIKWEGDEKHEEFQSEGHSSHSSLPERGLNALTRLALQVTSLDLDHEPLNRIMDMLSSMHNDFYGLNLGFNQEIITLQGQQSGKTVVNPTMIRLEGDCLEVNMNIRHRCGIGRDDINEIFSEIGRREGFTFTIENYLDPLHVPQDHPLFPMMEKAYQEVTGRKGGFALAGGTSYAKALPSAVSWGPLFPGEEDSCHQENERISLDSLFRAACVYGRFLAETSLHLPE